MKPNMGVGLGLALSGKKIWLLGPDLAMTGLGPGTLGTEGGGCWLDLYPS